MASALGAPARNLATLRVKKMARGRDWELDGTTVLLTEAALTTLLALLESPVDPRVLAQQCRAPGAPVQFTARVTGFPPNPRLLHVAWREADLDRSAHIITAKRDNFRIGMEVPIRLNPTSQRYELARRVPRMKGRW